MKKVAAFLLAFCLCIGLCACKEDNTCVNCDSDWEVEHEGKKYCADCYNSIPGVELICVNCGEKTGTLFDCCDECYEKIRDHAHDLWTQD